MPCARSRAFNPRTKLSYSLGSAGDAGDSAVYRQQQIGRPFGGDAHDFGSQAVTEVKTIGHQVGHVGKAELAQAPEDKCRTGRSVRIKITNDDNASLSVLKQEIDGCVNSWQRANGCEQSQGIVEFCRTSNATRSQYSRKQRIELP